MMGNLTRCQSGYMFPVRRYGTVCPYCYIETATKEKQETGSTEEGIKETFSAQDLAPICGWIVCISGARQDEDYKIKSGKNSIGRADDMNVQILGDNRISRRNHSVIMFDPKKKETATLLGDPSGIVYLNDNAVYTLIVLKSYDATEMGDSKFVSVPFCGKSFMWEDDGGKS